MCTASQGLRGNGITVAGVTVATVGGVSLSACQSARIHVLWPASEPHTPLAPSSAPTFAPSCGGCAPARTPNPCNTLLVPPISHSSHPTVLTGLSAIAITSGYYHTCAIVMGGGVKCWGNNDVGQLGIRSTTNQNSPVDVELEGAERHTREREKIKRESEKLEQEPHGDGTCFYE